MILDPDVPVERNRRRSDRFVARARKEHHVNGLSATNASIRRPFFRVVLLEYTLTFSSYLSLSQVTFLYFAPLSHNMIPFPPTTPFFHPLALSSSHTTYLFQTPVPVHTAVFHLYQSNTAARVVSILLFQHACCSTFQITFSLCQLQSFQVAIPLPSIRQHRSSRLTLSLLSIHQTKDISDDQFLVTSVHYAQTKQRQS